jgi:cytidyltransferase-like protein
MSIGAFFGRFSPLHVGHAMVIEEMRARHDEVHVFVVNGQSSSPFPVELRKTMVSRAFPDVSVSDSPNAFLPALARSIPGKDFVLYTGPDRLKSFLRHPSYMEEIGKSLDIVALDFDREGVSGTRVREMIVSGDVEGFRSMVPNVNWPLFDLLKQLLEGSTDEHRH